MRKFYIFFFFFLITESALGQEIHTPIKISDNKINIDGIIDTKVGYSGGIKENPTYEEVCVGHTEHVEVVMIRYNINILNYSDILNFFWLCHDPTQLNRQGPDYGRQYRSSIFYYTESQKLESLASLKIRQQSLSKKIVTEISPVKKFYLAEDYHQLYIKKRA